MLEGAKYPGGSRVSCIKIVTRVLVAQVTGQDCVRAIGMGWRRGVVQLFHFFSKALMIPPG